MIKCRDEEIAKRILKSFLPRNYEVICHDTGVVPGAYDLQIQKDGIPIGCVEVTSTVRGEIRALNKALTRDCKISAPKLSSIWILYLEPGAPIKRIRKESPRLLLKLEEKNLFGFIPEVHWVEYPEVNRLSKTQGSGWPES